MPTHKKISPFLKTNNDTGFGSNASSYGGRFINRNGTFNLRKDGVSFFKKISVYQKMINLSKWKFIITIILFYLIINLLFTTFYLLAGLNELQGLISKTPWQTFKEVYFFSTQTFTTVGYGRVNPIGDKANLIASFEALAGLLTFAIATGLIYGRFAKPKSFLEFSEYALVAPFKDITALMFRFANYKDNHILTNVEIKVNIALRTEESGTAVYKFYDLPLERNKIDSLPMNWTVVHPINETSPIMGFTLEDMESADAELYVLISGFDDVYSCSVLQRTSYTYQEMKFKAKFIPMYRESEDGKTTILEMHKLNTITEID
jgi:inward rectifier potassium channel